MTRSLEARLLEHHERDAVLDHLRSEPRTNLFLMDLVARFGSAPSPGETRAEVAVVRRAGEIVGVAALRPTIVLDAGIGPEAIEALLPFVEALSIGLVKSPEPAVAAMWRHLRGRRGRQAIVDRNETAYALEEGSAHLAGPPRGSTARSAAKADLDALVYAARESLREENRPDPFAGDARSFRRWVRGRVPRARVVESDGRILFVGYADVQRPEGWLLQGIYTWPDERRRGFGAAGTSQLCREAFREGAAHVQLAVVDGNRAARALYERLGFEPFARLRTILFA